MSRLLVSLWEVDKGELIKTLVDHNLCECVGRPRSSMPMVNCMTTNTFNGLPLHEFFGSLLGSQAIGDC